MRLLLDTNIIVDILTRRAGYEESRAVLRRCEAGCAEGLVSVVTVTDVMYILRKHMDSGSVRDATRGLLLVVTMQEVLGGDITAALDSPMRDFEDAVQASCAARAKADYIVTRNIKDFSESPVPAVTPAEMLERLKNL